MVDHRPRQMLIDHKSLLIEAIKTLWAGITGIYTFHKVQILLATERCMRCPWILHRTHVHLHLSWVGLKGKTLLSRNRNRNRIDLIETIWHNDGIGNNK